MCLTWILSSSWLTTFEKMLYHFVRLSSAVMLSFLPSLIITRARTSKFDQSLISRLSSKGESLIVLAKDLLMDQLLAILLLGAGGLYILYLDTTRTRKSTRGLMLKAQSVMSSTNILNVQRQAKLVQRTDILVQNKASKRKR
jgi:hypothetical protein